MSETRHLIHQDTFVQMITCLLLNQVTVILDWMVRMASDLESNIVSVERIKEFTDAATEVRNSR